MNNIICLAAKLLVVFTLNQILRLALQVNRLIVKHCLLCVNYHYEEEPKIEKTLPNAELGRASVTFFNSWGLKCSKVVKTGISRSFSLGFSVTKYLKRTFFRYYNRRRMLELSSIGINYLNIS